MVSLRLILLGGLEIRDDSGCAVPIAEFKAALLLAYLASRQGQALSREKLIGLLWGDRNESQARGSLRHAIWALRRALKGIEPSPLLVEGDTLALNPLSFEADAVTFQELLAEGSPQALQSAVRLYGGEFLEGVRVRDSAFEAALASERQRLHELAVDACTKLLHYQLEATTDHAAAATAKRLLAIDPLQEIAHRALMEHHAKMGQLGLAHKQYQTCREILKRELNVEPDLETERLFNRIRLCRPCMAAIQSGSADQSRSGRGGGDARPGPSEFDRQAGKGIGPASLAAASLGTSGSDPALFENRGQRVGEPRVQQGTICLRCGYKNSAEQKFCGECGRQLAVSCAVCSTANAPRQNFCGECGAPLRAGHAPPEFASPNAYTPKYLATRILTTQSAIEGERKQVTVLFADLEGSIELVSIRDPEDARNILDPIIKLMVDAVHRYEGTVNRVLSDGIMALFGAPLSHEDHALRACYASLTMQESVQQVTENIRHKYGIKPQLRIGLNSGEVVVRAIGNDLSIDYDAIGPTTLLAGRLEQLAVPGTTRLTQNTLRMAEGLIRVRPLGLVPIEGFADPIEIYELEDATSTHSRFQTPLARGLSKFVGRQNEMNALRHALDRAIAGHGQVFALVGEPGVGKSRLFYEFTHEVRGTSCLILECGAVSYGTATPYLPVIDLLKGYFQVSNHDDARRIREKVTGKLFTLDEELKPALPALLALLDVPVEDEAWLALEPSKRRRQTLEAIKAVMFKESHVQPLIVVFEDLHWVDNETLAVLDDLVDALPAAPILLLVNFRLEFSHKWGNKSYYNQKRIEPLPPEIVTELLDELLGADIKLAQLKRILIKRTEGSPFFVEECLRTLVETSVLDGGPGAYRLTRDVDSIEVPATVQGVLVARIDRLALDDKQLLQTASVIGKDVPVLLLKTITELSEETLQARLAALRAAEFLHETRLFPDAEYTFKHALTHEVTYGSLLEKRRQALHKQIVDAIEELYPDRIAEHVDRLAHHAVRGELWERAVNYLRQSGAKATAHSAYRESVANFEQALCVLDHLPRSREISQQVIDLRFDHRSSLQALGDHERVFEHLREAEALASALDDKDRLGWASAYLCQYLWWMGDPVQADALGRRALTIACTLRDSPLKAAATFFLGQGYFNVGNFQRAIEFFRRSVASIKGDRAYERLGLTGLPSVLSRVWLAWALAEQGEFSEAMEHAKEAHTIAEAADQPYSLAAAYLGFGQVRLLQGSLGEAIPMLERAARLCQVWNLRVIFPMAAGLLGLAYSLSGRPDEALPLLEESEADAPPVRIFDSAAAATALGTGYLLAHKLNEAEKFARHAVELASKRGFRGCEAMSLKLLGEISTSRDPPQRRAAEQDTRHAVALANELGMRPLVAHANLRLGQLYQRIGERQNAEKYIATAEAMYREMGMCVALEPLGSTGSA
ncbi:MAG: adenylate/guanylate cyclase domain-containing protein [Alphaproteobacteria bacterium]